jgi:hypothetical protein
MAGACPVILLDSRALLGMTIEPSASGACQEPVGIEFRITLCLADLRV